MLGGGVASGAEGGAAFLVDAGGELWLGYRAAMGFSWGARRAVMFQGGADESGRAGAVRVSLTFGVFEVVAMRYAGGQLIWSLVGSRRRVFRKWRTPRIANKT